ncbi:hypothetical protein BTH42_15060 [Burkholderia sp. SRS-W-2-2016]|uniref:hypothetical protein n=1 Tax=Burkholderia sp. SRS-W-2-2016 TaxID=1926878 RepID=UPI00094B2F77|nr:hypothetical protein [Burkholderia sp. SRS-W-2-2016]OLL30800.1 hypothetical protein BTH42_15060 [Burkholderia sp. SRS-W-2-2016]
MVAHALTIGEWVLLAGCASASIYTLAAALAMPFFTARHRSMHHGGRYADCFLNPSFNPGANAAGFAQPFAPLADPAVGVVTCLYVVRGVGGFWPRVGAARPARHRKQPQNRHNRAAKRRRSAA